MNKKYLDLIYKEEEFIKSKGKKFEYHHLVKAISKFDSVNIKQSIEEPDFILEMNGIDIGIEIITLVDSVKRIRTGTLQNVLDKISEEIESNFTTKYLLSIYFYDDILFDKIIMFQECKRVIEHYIKNIEIFKRFFRYKDDLISFIGNNDAINSYIKNREIISIKDHYSESEKLYIQNIKNNLDDYIENKEIIDVFLINKYIEHIFNGGKTSSMELRYDPGGFAPLRLTENVLNRFVEKKNKKVNQYKKNLNGNDCWLLLVTCTNEYQYDLYDEYPPNLTVAHNFEKILLLHDHSNKLFEWNNEKWNLIE